MTTSATTTITPTERVLNQLKGCKPLRSGKPGYTALCPAHRDTNASLMIWEDEQGHCGVKCFAGCSTEAICTSIGLTKDDLRTEASARKGKIQPLTLIDLAIDKHIHPNDLMLQFGLAEGEATFKKEDGSTYTKKGVVIPYSYMDGRPFERTRLRTSVTAKQGSIWSTDNTTQVIPYGLDGQDEARKAGYDIFVEGESDLWTLRLHGFPALGFPGAQSVTGTLKMEYLEGINCIYILQEPDTGGQKFTLDIKAFLDKHGYKGKLYILNLHELFQAKDANDLHKRLRAQGKGSQDFKAAIEQARTKAHEKPLHRERKKPTIQRLRDLQHKELPETRWAIDPILPEGVTLLAGKPKLGKSWLALAMLNAISSGGVALGAYPVERGEVLYISLEDNDKRLKKRSNIVLQNAQASEDFYYATSWPRMNEGGYEALEEWIQEHPRARLICIDTWARFKPKAHGRQNQQYDEDYEALTPLQNLASERGVSILVVDHMRKMESEDPLDMVAGSTGKTGAVDGFLLLYRKRGETGARLFVIGRDIEEEQELILNFNQECASWVVKGDADDATIATTPQQQELLDEIVRHKQGIPLKELAKRLDKNINTTRNLLEKLRHQEKIILQNNVWSVVTHSKDSKDSKDSNHSNPSHRVDSGYYASSQVTTEATIPVVTPDIPAAPPGEPIKNGHSHEATTLTTLTTDDMKETIRHYGETYDYPPIKGDGYMIPRGKQGWDGFLRWQDGRHEQAYRDMVAWMAAKESVPV